MKKNEKLDTIVIVSGQERSGTTQFSTYIHLYSDAFFFIDPPNFISMSNPNTWTKDNLWMKNDERKVSVINTEHTKRIQDIKSRVNAKNDLFLKDPASMPDVSCIGVRCHLFENKLTEHMMSSSQFNELKNKFQVKLVYPMRKDIIALFNSQSQILPSERTMPLSNFANSVLKSYREICKLKTSGWDICTLDITIGQSQKELIRLDEFLGLKPSKDQLWWQKNVPVIHPRSVYNSLDIDDQAKADFDNIAKEYTLTRNFLLQK